MFPKLYLISTTFSWALNWIILALSIMPIIDSGTLCVGSTSTTAWKTVRVAGSVAMNLRSSSRTGDKARKWRLWNPEQMSPEAASVTQWRGLMSFNFFKKRKPKSFLPIKSCYLMRGTEKPHRTNEKILTEHHRDNENVSFVCLNGNSKWGRSGET